MASDYEVVGYKEARKPHGCVFYGCIAAIVLTVLVALAVGIGLFFLYRYAMGEIEKYTETAPAPIAAVEMPAEQRGDVHKKWDDFVESLKAEDQPAESLTLNSDEINALIDDKPDLKGKVHVDIKGDQVQGQVSLPLGEIMPPLKGRFLNASGTFKVSLHEGILLVTAESLTVKGQPIPENAMAGLRQQNLAKDVYNDPKNAEVLRKLDSIEVKDGQVVIKAKPKGEAGKSESDTASTTPTGDAGSGRLRVDADGNADVENLSVSVKKTDDGVRSDQTVNLPDSDPPVLTRERVDRIVKGMDYAEARSILDGKIPVYEVDDDQYEGQLVVKDGSHSLTLKLKGKGPKVDDKAQEGIE